MSCSGAQLLAPLKLVWDSPVMLRLLPIMLYWSDTPRVTCVVLCVSRISLSVALLAHPRDRPSR